MLTRGHAFYFDAKRRRWTFTDDMYYDSETGYIDEIYSAYTYEPNELSQLIEHYNRWLTYPILVKHPDQWMIINDEEDCIEAILRFSSI
jgi:hypothetical protein